MNLKRLSIILLILGIFLIGFSAVSASENATDNALKQNNDVDLIENSVDEPVLANESSAATPDNSGSVSKTEQKSNTSTPIKTKVSAPSVVKTYKKKGTFKITVKDEKKNPIKKLKLNVKVYTGKKYKTYKITTNSKGIVTLSTKKLKIGTHKVVISSANKGYSVSKKSSIIIGKKKTLSLKINRVKSFKNGDYFHFFKEPKNAQYEKGVYVENLRIYKGNLRNVESHHIIKVKYTFKNINGLTLTKTSTYKDMFKTSLIKGYEPVSAKITYIQS
ncbi:hypothetical protein [Methanobrevibacter sp.]